MIDNLLVLAVLDSAQSGGSDSTPWFFSNEVVGATIGALLAAALTFVITRRATSNAVTQDNVLLSARLKEVEAELGLRDTELTEANTRITELAAVQDHYGHVRELLGKSIVVQEFEQPVLLLGPRFVGKSSLLAQWHAPWDRGPLAATRSHRRASVPVYDFRRPDAVPHFADPDVRTAVDVHLKLRVHDFPGELSAQASAIETARAETAELREKTGRNLGVVLVCMFDAAEAGTELREETVRYYNGDLFASIRTLVSHRDVDIQRLVIVFNKFDVLLAKRPGEPVEALLELCVESFSKTLQPLYGACNPERVCETVTVLDRDNLLRSQGATVVFGEVARGIVDAMSGSGAADRLMGEQRATTYMSRNF
ncbi:hypothetical protein [Saccharothrix longispora]|uniref:hypothetical protein n=1 Tax=Saccharothrix longispora TaxID=33920 RepID=UPI0028FD62C4|nr:hypothetical protein [Saccharothrix longispora]MDU0291999.1 hypothetical protein [Saccharothrix longispora]